MFCRSGYYVGFILLLWPFSTDILFLSFFQCLVSRAPLSAVTETLLEAIEGIPDNTKIITFEGTKTSTIFTRDYFMSENLRVDV